MSDNTRIKNIIRALLAKANSTDSEEERDSFLAKAGELMHKHQIEEYELGHEDEIGVTIGVSAQNGPPSYKSMVQCALARFYGCHPIRKFTTEKHWTVHLVGPESARATTELMTEFVWSQVIAHGKVLRAERHMKQDVAVRHIAKALAIRVSALAEKRKQDITKHQDGTSFSLVVVNKVRSFIEANYTNLSMAKVKKRSIHRRAVELAGGIHIDEQLQGRNPLRLH